MRVPAVERRQQLIEAAVRLMSREGIEAATLRAIAEEAGAPLSAVHYCFRDKDELVHEAVEFWLQQLVRIAEDAAVEGGLSETVTRFATDFWRTLEQDPPNVLAQLEVVIWASRGEAHRDLARSIYARYEQALSDLIEKALSQAGEEARLPSGLLARGILAIIDSCSLQYFAQPDSDAPRQLFETLIASLLRSADVRRAVPAR